MRHSGTSQTSIRNYWWHAAIATSLVLVAPPVIVWSLETGGYIRSPIVSVAAGVAGSMVMAWLGAMLWMRLNGSRDVVFSDLLLWGYLRRLFMERRIMNSAKLLSYRSVSRDANQIRTLQRLAAALEATDPYTHGHSRRVARITCMIAKGMGLPKKRIQFLRAAAAVHDVGKLYVPSHIINKPGKLTPEEFELVKQHSAKGSELVARLGNRDLTAIVRHHHERVDGKGYPDGLAGTSIPLGARIIAVADTFDAMTSSRPYRDPVKHKEVLETLRRAAGTQLDSEAVQAFLAYYSGKRSLARWALVASAPHRWIGELSGWLQGVATAGIKGSAAAVGSAALLTGSVLTGSAVAPAVAKHLPELEMSRSEGQVAAGATKDANHSSTLPPGLAKKGTLPPGLRKKDELPPGLQKKLTGEKKPRGRAKQIDKPSKGRHGAKGSDKPGKKNSDEAARAPAAPPQSAKPQQAAKPEKVVKHEKVVNPEKASKPAH